jgi:hypothetical protein
LIASISAFVSGVTPEASREDAMYAVWPDIQAGVAASRSDTKTGIEASMRRVFFHVDEFGTRGMSYLPHLACLSDPLVIWGPSVALLESTQHSLLRGDDLLRLIDQPNAPIRVIGREKWLLDKEFRNSREWPSAHWVERFDEVVRRFAIEDSSRNIFDRRVIIAPPEQGFTHADTVLGSDIAAPLADRLNELYTKRALPIGMLEKADRAKAKGDSVVKMVLRDVYNHSRAMESAMARSCATPSEHMGILQSIVPGAMTPGLTFEDRMRSKRTELAQSDLREAVQVLSSLKPILSAAELSRFLQSDHRRDLHALMYSSRSAVHLKDDLVREIRQVFPVTEPAGMRGDNWGLTLGAIVIAATVSLITQNAEWMIGPIVVEMIRESRSQTNVPPRLTATPPRTLQALFLLLYGETQPDPERVRDLLGRLMQVVPS